MKDYYVLVVEGSPLFTYDGIKAESASEAAKRLRQSHPRYHDASMVFVFPCAPELTPKDFRQ